MPNLNVLVVTLIAVVLGNQAIAESEMADDGLKYFVIQGTPKPEVIRQMVANPADPMPAASIEGAKLVDYYFAVGQAQNLAIIAVPDSKYAAAITYQRMGTELMDDMVVYEVIPASRVAEMLGIANKMNESDAYQKD